VGVSADQAEPVWADWPELLQRVAEARGAGVALRLAASYGGRELYVPRPEAIDELHPLALALGLAAARHVADVLGHGKIMVPLGPASSIARRKDLIRELLAKGKSNAQVAEALGIHRRTVELRRQRDREAGIGRADPSQIDLFES